MAPDRKNQAFTLNDGRRLGFAEYGAPAGQPVFHFHGSASSRFERPTSEDMLIQMNIRFISVDRPGYGLSDFQPDRCILDWPQDIRQLADHLDIDTFLIEGYSAGGPYALACAYQLPERVTHGAVIGCAAPMNRPRAYAGMPLANQLLARSARWFPLLTKFIRWIMRRMVTGDAQNSARRLMASIPESDKTILYEHQNIENFVQSVREGFRAGSQGVALDDILINRNWGFDLEKIQPRIDIWQGDADVNVPVQAARYLASGIPNARLTILPGLGHFFLFDRWQDILAKLVQ